jgi:ribosomal protein S18 acetylase RimI-like enzyme
VHPSNTRSQRPRPVSLPPRGRQDPRPSPRSRARPSVHRATADELPLLAALISNSCLSMDLFRWMEPRPEERRCFIRTWAAADLRQALDTGLVEYLPGFAGVAVWLPVRLEPLSAGPENPPSTGLVPGGAGPQELPRPSTANRARAFANTPRTRSATGHPIGRRASRFASYQLARAQAHPQDTPHLHLAWLTVHPVHRNRGLGSALLRHRHAELDSQFLPSYMEAPGPRSRRFALSMGYVDCAEPVVPAHSREAVHPMWRFPGSGYPDKTAAGRTPVSGTSTAGVPVVGLPGPGSDDPRKHS